MSECEGVCIFECVCSSLSVNLGSTVTVLCEDRQQESSF